MFANNPFKVLDTWLAEEAQAGAPNPKQGVLSTATTSSAPHARVVAVKEVNQDGLVFFSQSGTRKVSEMKANPQASLVFWFELLQREVILEGSISPLSDLENREHWQEYPKEAQIRFYSYAPTSSQAINNKQTLEVLRTKVRKQYQETDLPISPYYVGFRLKPVRIIFYAYQIEELSDVMEYKLNDQHWQSQVLSP